ncbi:hypothetical protein GQX74_012165 [Glossina fuscipes]|nr:hypothetical protein GQX74_012165 [Glossina fuscipes]
MINLHHKPDQMGGFVVIAITSALLSQPLQLPSPKDIEFLAVLVISFYLLILHHRVFEQAANPYLTGIPANTYSPYFAPGHLVPALLGPDPAAVASQLGPVVPQAVQVTQQKLPRSDRLERVLVKQILNNNTNELDSLPFPNIIEYVAYGIDIK